MDKSLLFLSLFCLLLLAYQAPFAVLTLAAIIALATVFIRGTWGFLQGAGSVPDVERVWNER